MPLNKSSKIHLRKDGSPEFLCIARRFNFDSELENDPVEQFSTKLDRKSYIKALDLTGLPSRYSCFLDKALLHTRFLDLVLPEDQETVKEHLSETLINKSAISDYYRIKVPACSKNSYLEVQTKSRFFKSPEPHNSHEDFIMATHSLTGPYIDEIDLDIAASNNNNTTEITSNNKISTPSNGATSTTSSTTTNTSTASSGSANTSSTNKKNISVNSGMSRQCGSNIDQLESIAISCDKLINNNNNNSAANPQLRSLLDQPNAVSILHLLDQPNAVI